MLSIIHLLKLKNEKEKITYFENLKYFVVKT